MAGTEHLASRFLCTKCVEQAQEIELLRRSNATLREALAAANDIMKALALPKSKGERKWPSH